MLVSAGAVYGVPYTILQLEKFAEIWIGFLFGAQLQKGPKVTIIGDGNTRMSFVSMDNVLDLVVGVLDHPAAINATLPFCAPGHLTYREIIQSIETMIGMPIEVEAIEPGESLPGFPPVVEILWAYLNNLGDSNLDTGDVARTYNVQMIGLEDCLRRMFAPMVQ